MIVHRRDASPALQAAGGPMNGDDDEFLDDVFDRAVAAATAGQRIDIDELVKSRPVLRSAIEGTVHLAFEVSAPRLSGLPTIPGYQVVAEIGRGGMAAVWLARQERLGGRLVALKVLPGADALSPRARSRFLAEAHALGRMRHGNVVTVHDVIDAPSVCAYAMEWITGRSLAHWLAAPRAADHELQACRWILQIAEALVAVHAHGLVHRDVKPSNILIRDTGTAVLVDFGLARASDAAVTVGFAGTAPYAAPEQLAADGAAVDARTDVYSLGATLYHALAGHPPFHAANPAAMARAIEQGTAPKLTRVNPRVSRDLETIVATAMAVAPERRYASANAFAEDLRRLLSLRPIVARPPSLSARLLKLATRNRRSLVAALASAMVVLACGAAVLAFLAYRAAIPGRIRAHVEAARLHLLSPEHGEQLFVATQVLGGEVLARIDAGALDRALGEYAAAQSLAGDDPDLTLEQAAVAAARSLGASGAVPPPRGPSTLLASHAARIRLGAVAPPITDESLTGAGPAERRAIGLFAYLTGDASLCARAWSGLDLAAAGDALIDAATGELFLQRAQPALAYPRLEAASRAFPDSGFIRVQLAAAALRSGDTERAGRLLDEAARMTGHDRFSTLRSVRAEWHAARGEVDEARRLYEWMRAHHRVPSVRMRYAQWLAQRGECLAAITVAREAIELHPGIGIYRRTYVDLVEAWWRGLGHNGARLWLTELATLGEKSWLLGALREYAESLQQLEGVSSAASAGATVKKSAIAEAPDTSPTTDRQRLLGLVSTLESSPLTLARSPSDPEFIRSLQVTAWSSSRPSHSWLASAARVALDCLRPRLLPAWMLITGMATGLSPANAQGCVSAPPGLVGWWPLEGGGADIFGGNHATQFGTGGVFEAGKVGAGFRSGGPGNGLRVPDSPSLDLTTLTIECWVRLDSIGSFHHPVVTRAPTNGSNQQTAYGLFILSSAPASLNPGASLTGTPAPGKLSALIADGTLEQGVVSAQPLSLGVFHHVAVTVSGISVAIYIDGSLSASAPQTRTPLNSGEPLRIGALENALNSLPGVVDEVSIYNRALTPAEIQGIYTAGAAGKCQPTCTSPADIVSWWRLDGNAADSSGVNPGAVVGTGGAFPPARVGQGFQSSGPGSCIRVEDHPSLDLTTLTLEAWVRLDSIGANNHTIVGRVPAVANSITTIPYFLGAVSNGGFGTSPGASVTGSPAPGKLWLILTDGIQEQVLFSPAPLSLGTFHHVAATVGSGRARLFVDGQLVTNAALVRTPFSSNDPLWIGGIDNIYNTWPGVVDEVTIFGRDLTPAEIQSIYAAGPAGKCTPNPVDATQTTVDTSAPLVSAFAGQATITVTPKNAAGAPLGAGRTVALTTTAGTLLGTSTDQGDGTYTQVLQASASATSATVTAVVDAVAIVDTATIAFIAIDPAQSTIAVSPDTTFLGGHATVTVTPKNDLGQPVGPGRAVVLHTTLGTLVGNVVDQGDGTYTQQLAATALGTASISATADGLALASSAALTVLDSSIGVVIGLRANGTPIPYGSIQQAVNFAVADQLVRILITPGVHEELVTVRQRQNLAFEGLSATGLVTVRGFRLSQCADLSFVFLDVEANANARHGFELVGGNHASQRITITQCSVRGATDNFDGIRIGRQNSCVLLDNLLIEQNAGDGVQLADGECEVVLRHSTIRGSGRNGVRCADQATVRIDTCTIQDSGTRGDDRQGYAIFRQRRAQGGEPTLITLIANLFDTNRGRVVSGKSDANLGNYDQMLDATDMQGGY